MNKLLDVLKNIQGLAKYRPAQGGMALLLDAINKKTIEAITSYNKDADWISVNDRTPEMIKGENYSENVFALINNELFVLCYCYIPGDDGGFVWANCDGKIDGDAEFDDEYEPTHWQPLPKPIK